MDNRFNFDTYLVRKKIFKFLGDAFHIFDPNGNVVFYSRLKAFKIREDIRVYTGEDMTDEVLSIRARQILDFSAAYDVVDTHTGERLGAYKRRGFKSMLRDEWIIMDPSDREIGMMIEDSMGMALLRRFLSNLIPQTFNVTMQGKTVCEFKQMFNPFVGKIIVDFRHDTDHVLDRRLGIAGAVLACAIEGKQG